MKSTELSSFVVPRVRGFVDSWIRGFVGSVDGAAKVREWWMFRTLIRSGRVARQGKGSQGSVGTMCVCACCVCALCTMPASMLRCTLRDSGRLSGS